MLSQVYTISIFMAVVELLSLTKHYANLFFLNSTFKAPGKKNQFSSVGREYRDYRQSELFSKGYLESYCINSYSIKCLQIWSGKWAMNYKYTSAASQRQMAF